MNYYSLSDSRSIEKQLSAVTNVPLNLVCSRFSGDITLMRRNRHGRRRALGKLVAELHLGPSCKADAMTFPQRQLSLTHSGHWSIAVGTRSLNVQGIGIDFETRKNLDQASTRLFLSQQERNRLSNNTVHALRLWSVKEAIFKSDPGNCDYRVWDYELCNPSMNSGRAFRKDCNRRFYYTSLNLLEGVLAIAVCTGRNPL